jgi:hypothetical protein
MRQTFFGNNAAFDIKKARFCKKILLLENFPKYCLDQEPVPKLFQSRNRNRNKPLRFYKTANMFEPVIHWTVATFTFGSTPGY